MVYGYVVCVRVLSMNGVSGTILSAARSANRFVARYCTTLLQSAVSHQYRPPIKKTEVEWHVLWKRLFCYKKRFLIKALCMRMAAPEKALTRQSDI